MTEPASSASLSLFSDEARALRRPFRTYAELASTEARGDGRRLLGKIGLFLLILGSFVSFTASGRLVADHLAGTLLFWSFAPLVQTAAIVTTVKLLAPRQSIVRALWLFFVGHGPWFLLLTALAGVCIFTPHVYAAMTQLLSLGILPFAIVLTFVWSVVLTTAFFRRGLGLGRARTALSTALYYVVYLGLIASYYFATDQVQSQIFGVPA